VITMVSRRRPIAALLVLIALILMLAAAAPVAASPSATTDPAVQYGDHVIDCNVEFDANGDILLEGSLLTPAQAVLLDALLAADASLAAALEAAADADADACVNLDIDLTGGLVVLNADIEACGDVTVDAGVITVGGVEIGADLLSSELSDVLEAAALADVSACAVVTVVDNEALVDAFATICANATLLDTGVVSVVIGSDEFFFDGTLVDADGLLEVGVTAEVNLTVTASLDVAAQTVELTIVASPCTAGGGGTSPTPSASPPGGGGGGGGSPSPGTSASPLPGLPDTAVWGGSVGAAVALVALLGLSLVGMVCARINRR
jgi:hypothetical protein